MFLGKIKRAVFITLALAGATACSGGNSGQSPALTTATTRFYADAEVSGEVSAPNALVLPAAKQAASRVMKLPLTLRLRNTGNRVIGLSASTSCAIFRWSVVDAQSQVVESQPNQLCAQAIASDILSPARKVEQSYEVLLETRHYTAGGHYRLMFSFWGYSGYHDFIIKKPI